MQTEKDQDDADKNQFYWEKKIEDGCILVTNLVLLRSTSSCASSRRSGSSSRLEPSAVVSLVLQSSKQISDIEYLKVPPTIFPSLIAISPQVYKYT